MKSLSKDQQAALREFTRKHKDETTGRLSINPIVLARVLGEDKPAGYINLKGHTYPSFGDRDRYLNELCRTLGLHTQKIKEARGWCISRSSWRLDMLPTVLSTADAFHRRCGIVYGYPREAVEDFLKSNSDVTMCDLVRAGIFTPEQAAYLPFVSYTYHNSIEKYEELIERGKRNRRCITPFSEEWELPVLEEYAQLLYEDAMNAYSGNASWGLPTMFPPDQDVRRKDIEPLLS